MRGLRRLHGLIKVTCTLASDQDDYKKILTGQASPINDSRRSCASSVLSTRKDGSAPSNSPLSTQVATPAHELARTSRGPGYSCTGYMAFESRSLSPCLSGACPLLRALDKSPPSLTQSPCICCALTTSTLSAGALDHCRY